MARVALVVIWFSAAGMAGVLAFIGYELSRSRNLSAVAQSGVDAAATASPNAWARWVVTEQFSAHRVLIAHVETKFLDESVAIAQQIAEPVKDRYAEVLIYFHRPGRPDTLPPRRVQWTRPHGYLETIY
jgi:hypothetical protein